MPKENPQQQLFEKGEWWEEHWKGMPEFIQKDLMPFKTIYVHFDSRADMESFSRLIGQPVGLNTKWVWYPEATIERQSCMHYIEAKLESELEQNDDLEILDAE